jgi:hypothetical protein
MAEAGQQKALLVLDRHWAELERIELDIGPRFHALSSAAPQLPPGLRAGDRRAALVRVSLPTASAGRCSRRAFTTIAVLGDAQEEERCSA